MLSCLSLIDDGPLQQQAGLNISMTHHPTSTTATINTPSTHHSPSQMRNKENIQPNKGKERNSSVLSPLQNSRINNKSSATSQKSMISEKGAESSSSLHTTSTSNKQELLRQQELEEQLKALQEQVS